MMTLTKCLIVSFVVCLTLANVEGKRNSVSKYNTAPQVVKQRIDELEERNERIFNAAQRVLGNAVSEELLDEIGMFQRAIADPLCDEDQYINLDCEADGMNRTYVDDTEYPTFSGQCNNLVNYTWGMAQMQHVRLLDHAYENSVWKMRQYSDAAKLRSDPDVDLPSPRKISNVVHATSTDKSDTSEDHSLALFYLMQFVSHDIVLTPEGAVKSSFNCCYPEEDISNFCLVLNITSEDADETFPDGYCMELRRSDTFIACDGSSNVQNQYNSITAYIDASMVYGSSTDEADNLRTNIGGLLKESNEAFPPQANDTDVEDLPCEVEFPYFCMAVGDTRGMVHPGLSTLHTIFVREHNRIAKVMAAANTDWSDDKVFMETRMILMAVIQYITYNEMLPEVLDSSYITDYNLSLDTYGGYSTSTDASIIQAFSIAFRYHHLMPSTFHKASCPSGVCSNTYTTDQSDVYENPHHILDESYSGVDGVALGLTSNKCPFTSGRVNDAARNKLFFSDDETFDIASINIVRGREWGTPAYIHFRELCDGVTVTDWSDLLTTHTQDEIDLLSSVYDVVDDVDLWTGLVTETKVGTSLSGPTQSCLVAMQFDRLRHGDRFWFENGFFSDAQVAEIKKASLARIFCDNLNVDYMRSDVLDSSSNMEECTNIAGMTLTNLW